MRCAKIKYILTKYYDGDLTVRDKKIIEKHLTKCKDCNTVYQRMKSFDKGLMIDDNLNKSSLSWGNIKNIISEKMISGNKVYKNMQYFWSMITGLSVIFMTFILLFYKVPEMNISQTASLEAWKSRLLNVVPHPHNMEKITMQFLVYK